jgi:hypothetical protein
MPHGSTDIITARTQIFPRHERHSEKGMKIMLLYYLENIKVSNGKLSLQ